MRVKVRQNALELHEKLIPADPEIPGGKQRYAELLSEVVGQTVEVMEGKGLNKFGKGYAVRTPKTRKKIFLSAEFVEEVYND